MVISWVAAILFSCFFYNVQAACEDTLGPKSNLTLYDGDGNVIETLIDCADLVANYLDLCNGDVGKQNGQCCASCSEADLECVDNSLILFNGMSCADFVNEDPCNCDNNQLKVRKNCCASCKDKVCAKCRDYLSEETYIEVTKADGEKEKITDCTDLVTNYLSLCKRYGKEGERCCESCSKEDLTCIDNSLKFWIVGEERQNCAVYVAGDPCRCDKRMVKRDCCASCENAVCDKCRDYLSADTYIEVTKADGEKEKITDCTDLVTNYLSLCNKYGKEGERCCESCSNEDLTCVDNSLKFWIVAGERQNCAEYVAGDPCRCDKMMVKKDCCASCENAVCEPCRDYLSESSYIEVTKADGSKEKITDCSDLVANYLSLCEKYGKEGERCCESCSGQDLTCVDNSLKFYMVDGQRQGCAEFVAGDGCRCDNAKVKKDCCASCENAVCEPCRDNLSPKNWIEVTKPNGRKEKVRSCQVLVDKYLSLCRKNFGKEGGQCCASCSEQDLECIDDTLVFFPVGKRKLTCEQYIQGDPCRCEDKKVKETCCASCENAVCDPCRDTLSKDVTVEIKSGGEVVETFRSCEKMVNKHLILCNKYGGDGGRCCASCQGKDLSCVDNTLRFYLVGERKFRCPQYIARDKCRCRSASVREQCCASCKDVDLDECCKDSTTWKGTVKSGEERCRRCTCAEINAAGLMEAACMPARSKARNNCCRSCSDLGYPPP